MAEEPIKAEEIAEWGKYIEYLKKAEKATEGLMNKTIALLNEVGEILKANQGSTAKDIEATVQAINKSVKAREQLSAVEEKNKKIKQELVAAEKKEESLFDSTKKKLQELAKARNELAIKQALGNTLTKEESQQLEDLQKEITDVSKALKDAGKSQEQINNEVAKANKLLEQENSFYAKAQKQLTGLIKTQRELEIRKKLGNKLTSEEEKELKKVTKEVQKLDKALKDTDEAGGIFFRSVGNYQKAVEKLKKTNAGQIGLAVAGGIQASQLIDKVFSSVFSGTAEKAQNFQLILERALNVINNVAVAVKDVIVGFAIPKIESFILRVEKVFTSSFTDEGRKRLEEIDKILKENAKTLESFKNPFIGIIDRVKETDSLTKELIKTRFALIQQEALLGQEIQNRIGREQVLAQITEDDTRGFAERARAAKELEKVQKERLGLELQLAEKQLDQQAKIVKIGLEREGIADRFSDAQIRSLEFLKDEEAFNKTNLEDLEKLNTAKERVNQLNIDSEIFDAERAEKNRKRLQDQLENTLDYLKDDFDALKTYNESVINNENQLYENRVKLTEETRRLGDKSFKDQQDALESFYGKAIPLAELLAETDSKALNEKIRLLDLGEKGEQLVLQSIRERQMLLKDLYDLEISLDQNMIDRNLRISESEQAQQQEQFDFAMSQVQKRYDQESFIQENSLLFRAKKLKEFNKENEAIRQKQLLDEFDYEKDLAEKTIIEKGERDQKIRELDQKLQHDLQALSDETVKKNKDLDREQFLSRLDYAQKLGDEFLNELETQLEKENALKQKYLDIEIDKRTANIDIAQRRFEEGLSNQLDFEQKKLAEAELARKDAEKKAALERETIQLIEATYQAYIARLKEPGANASSAVSKALADTLLIKEGAKFVARAAFFEGTERVKDDLKGNKVHSGRDGYDISVDGEERILTGKQNNIIPRWMDNDMLANIAYDFSKGNLASGTAQNIYASLDLQPLIGEIKGLRQDINKLPRESVDIDSFGRVVKTVIEGSLKTVTRQNKSLWKQ